MIRILPVMCVLMLLSGALSARQQRIYFAHPSGTNTNCATAQGTQAVPPTAANSMTISRALECAAPGDKVWLRGAPTVVAPYTRWEDGIQQNDRHVPSGTPSAWITVENFPGETVTQRLPNGRSGIGIGRGDNAIPGSYLIFRGNPAGSWIIDMVNSASGGTGAGAFGAGNGAHHLRFEGLEAKNGGGGVLVGFGGYTDYGNDPASFIEVINNKIHGTDHYCIYASSPDTSYIGNECYDAGGWGFHLYNNDATDPTRGHDRVKVIGNKVWNFGLDQANYGSAGGILVAHGDDFLIANNFVTDGPSGIHCWNAVTDCKVYNNTVTGVTGECIYWIWAISNPGESKNNICYGNGDNNPALVYNSSVAVPQSNNLSGVNPLFVNASTRDFRIQQGSPAQNQGLTLSVVSTDFEGTARPQGAAFDIGADEVTEGGQPPPQNQPPTVNAGADMTVTLPSSATVTGIAGDDGLPNPPGALTYAWAKWSGPGTVTFGSPSSITTTASFSSPGVYVLRLTVSDGALAPFDDMTVTVNVAPPPPPPTGPYEYDILNSNGNLTDAQVKATLNQRAALGWKTVAIGSHSSSRVFYQERPVPAQAANVEYDVLNVSGQFDSQVVTTLNDRAQHGWRLIAASHSGGSTRVLYFERQIP